MGTTTTRGRAYCHYRVTRRIRLDSSFTAGLARLAAAAQEVGGAISHPGTEHAVAFTHFDTPASEDNTVTILLTKENMDRLPSRH